MALKAKVFKAELQVSDFDRNYYETHALTLAQHPSETDERLMVRVLAFALHADSALALGRGLSSEEPDLWRKDLTGQTLDSIARNKSDLSDVLIIDDGSTDYDEKWLRQWGWKIVRNAVNLGVGEMARKRYEEFLTRGYAYLCAIDNDLQLGAHFDYRLLRLWQQTRSAELTVVTGYRSKTQVCLESNPEWDVVNSVGGAMQFADRHTAQIIFTKMQDQWAHNWDHRISLLYQRKIATRRSLAQHLGIYGSGVNGPSQDLAVDFVGDNQW